MKFGCSASVNEISFVQNLGFDYVELHGREVAALSEAEMDSLEGELARLHLPCLSLNAFCPPQIVIAGPDYNMDTANAYLQKLAERASRIGVKAVGIGSPFSRRLPDGYDRKLADEQLLGFVTATAYHFSQYGIATGIEPLGPCYCNYINHVDEVIALLAHLDDPRTGLTLDFYNMEHSGEADMPLENCAPHILHAHISDDLNGDPTKRAFLREDKLDIHRKRIHRLMASGYDKTLSLEVDIAVNEHAKEDLAFLRKVADESSHSL